MIVNAESGSTEFDIEFPQGLQVHLSRLFSGSYLLFNPSRRHYEIAADIENSAHTGNAQSFYAELLNVVPRNLTTKRPLPGIASRIRKW